MLTEIKGDDMNEKPEKLGDEFYDILVACGVRTNKGFIVDKLLQACKEAGLRFVEIIVDDSTRYNEPDKATHTQIEDIEI